METLQANMHILVCGIIINGLMTIQAGLMVLQLRSQTDMVRYVAVAGPYDSADNNDNNIYLPYSIYQEFENSGSIQLKVQVIYELEQANKNCIEPLDNAIYHGDMRELMESAMNEFPLLQKHTQFSVSN
jgi:hypothetical protein